MKRFLCLIVFACLLSAGFVRAQVQIGKANTAPTIDGTIEQVWESQPQYVAIDPTTWTPSPDLKNLDDCSYKWSGLWDANNLYLLFIIKDDILAKGVVDGPNYSWMNDNVEVSLNDPAYDGDKYKWRFSWERDGLHLTAKEGPEGTSYVTKAIDGGYVIEAQIPWNILSNDTVDFSAYPAIDKELQVNFTVADLDKPEGSSWDELSGHVQWPKGWEMGNIILKETTAKDASPPATPGNVAAKNVTFNAADVSWSAVSDADLVAYLVLKNGAPVAYITDKSTAYAAALLAPETNFEFTVIASDGQNLSAVSNKATFTTLAKPTLKDVSISEYTGKFPNVFEDLDFWEKVPVYRISYKIGGAIENDADLSAFFKVVWDKTNLYIQTNVVDQSVVNAVAAPWDNDNIEYHFDIKGERDGTGTDIAFVDQYQQDNFQYRGIPYKGEIQTGSTPAPIWTGVKQNTYDYFGTGVSVIGYTLEINFPWAALNTTAGTSIVPAYNTKIAFDIKVTDIDPDQPRTDITWSTYDHAELFKKNEHYGMFILGQGITGIDKPVSEQLSVYPNPANQNVTVTIPNNYRGSITLFDISGKIVLSQQVNSNQVNLNVAGIQSGIYVVTLTTESNLALRSKLVIK